MAGKILDTNKLIRHWKRCRKRSLDDYTKDDAGRWAEELVKLYETRFILTPVYLEFIAGVGNRHEMGLAKAYLGVFEPLDGGIIKPEDWTKARQLAERIPADSRPRGALDCLIKAITIRLKCELLTDDRGIPRH